MSLIARGSKPASSIAAIQKADKLLPDVAVLVVDGVHDFRIADGFKKAMPHLPLFLMTTTLSVEIEKKALSHGVDAVFSADDDFMTLALNAQEICPEKYAAITRKHSSSVAPTACHSVR
jgi:hypothetical protein